MSDQETDNNFQERCGRLVQNEVIVCLSYLVSTLAKGNELFPRNVKTADLFDVTEQAAELTYPIPDYEEAAIQAGWTKNEKDVVWTNPDTDAEYESAEEVCAEERIEPYEREVYEHWAVSTWLAEKLTEHGEKVDTDFTGLNVWARTTTGQAIAMDWVIGKIVQDQEKKSTPG